MMQYFLSLLRSIVKREFITMDKTKRVYQIDVVKEVSEVVQHWRTASSNTFAALRSRRLLDMSPTFWASAN